MIYKEVLLNDFIDAFKKAKRDQYTYDGYKALYEYFEEYSESTGQNVELDVIAICCEYVEYKDLKQIQDDYPSINSIEDLEDHTQVIEFDTGLIIAEF